MTGAGRIHVNIRRLAALIGAGPASRLVAALGGVEGIYVPKDPRRGGGRLERIIGPEAARKLAAEFGGREIDVARGVTPPRKAAIMDASGPAREVALAVGVTQRYVRKVHALQRVARPSPQLDLL